MDPIEKFRDDLQRTYRQQQSEMVKRGMRSMLLDGYLPARPPLGYEKTSIKGLYAPNSLGLKIGNVLRTFANGTITHEEARLNIYAVVLEDTDKRLTRYQITDILINSYYAGLVSWDGETHDGCHQSLINIEQFDEILKRLDVYIKTSERSRLPETSERN